MRHISARERHVGGLALKKIWKFLICSSGLIAYRQWCIAKNGDGYTQTGVAKGLKVPCLFMITEVSIRSQKTTEVGIRRIPAYTPQYTTAYRLGKSGGKNCPCMGYCVSVCAILISITCNLPRLCFVTFAILRCVRSFFLLINVWTYNLLDLRDL